jgi:hypothetical protein
MTEDSFQDPRSGFSAFIKKYAGWLGVIVLISVQFALFLQFAKREIVWGYPMAFDQTAYLTQAYETFEHIRTDGLFSGLLHGLQMRVPNGTLLHLQAALLYFVLGPTRLSSLTLNFAYFALLQGIFVWVVRWFSRSWSIAYLGLGALLTTAGRFMLPGGGLYDFRIDFISICLFGILICIAIRAGLLASRRWAVIFGATAAYTVLFRFIVLAYVVGIFIVWLAALLLRIRLTKVPGIAEVNRQRIQRVGIAAAVFAGLAGPALYYSRTAIYTYYYLGHIKGDKDIRVAEVGTAQLIDALLYYPRSLFFTHLGITFLWLVAIVLATLAVVAWRFGAPANSPEVTHRVNLGDLTIFLFVAFAVPFGILTIDASKSPVVGGVLIFPILWLFVIAATVLRERLSASTNWRRGFVAIMAGLAICTGLNMAFQASELQFTLTLHRDDTMQVLRLYDRVFQEAQRNGWPSPRIAMDRTYDFLHPQLIPAIEFERHQVLLVPVALLGGTVFPVSRDIALGAIENSDLAILTVSPARVSGAFLTYPFDHSMQAIEPDLLAAAESKLVPIQRFHISGQDFELYERPGPGGIPSSATMPDLETDGKASIETGSLSPHSGEGITQLFSIVFSDSHGGGDITYADLVVNDSLDTVNSCSVHYQGGAKQTFTLLDNGDSLWHAGVKSLFPEAARNGQCEIDLGKSAAVIEGEKLTLRVALTFRPNFAGTKSIYALAANRQDVSTGYSKAGRWVVSK